MDRLATEPILAHGNQEDAQNSDRFLAITLESSNNQSKQPLNCPEMS
jgi:hypothetical protein